MPLINGKEPWEIKKAENLPYKVKGTDVVGPLAEAGAKNPPKANKPMDWSSLDKTKGTPSEDKNGVRRKALLDMLSEYNKGT